jgi:hypothetical protein
MGTELSDEEGAGRQKRSGRIFAEILVGDVVCWAVLGVLAALDISEKAILLALVGANVAVIVGIAVYMLASRRDDDRP